MTEWQMGRCVVELQWNFFVTGMNTCLPWILKRTILTLQAESESLAAGITWRQLGGSVNDELVRVKKKATVVCLNANQRFFK